MKTDSFDEENEKDEWEHNEKEEYEDKKQVL